MPRSVKKGPYIQESLLKKVTAAKESQSQKVIKIYRK